MRIEDERFLRAAGVDVAALPPEELEPTPEELLETFLRAQANGHTTPHPNTETTT
jgi:hypothetical protein